MTSKEFMEANEKDRRGPVMEPQIDIALILNCGTSECLSRGSHDPNVGGADARTAMTGMCSRWTVLKT